MSSKIELVMAFLNAWEEIDMDAVNRMMSPDIVYRNTGYPDAFGHEGVRKALASLIDTRTPLTTVVHAIAEATDGVVMTERTDTIHHAKGAVTFPVMGAFDVHDGLITGWRDYFDASLFKTA
jgi:limonene-1,2-epoxide hydrolase